MTDLTKRVICSNSPACGFTQCPHFLAHLPVNLGETDGWREPQPNSTKGEHCSTCSTECTQILSDVKCDYADGTVDPVTVEDLIYDDRNLIIESTQTIDGLELEKLTCAQAALCAIALTHGFATAVEDGKGDLVMQVNADVLAQAAAISASVDNKCKS